MTRLEPVDWSANARRMLDDAARRLDGPGCSWQIQSLDHSTHEEMRIMVVFERASQPGIDLAVVEVSRRRGAPIWSWSVVDGAGVPLTSGAFEVYIGDDANAIEQFATFLSDAHAPLEAYLRDACG